MKRLKKMKRLDWILVGIEFAMFVATVVTACLPNAAFANGLIASVMGVYSLVCLIYYNVRGGDKEDA